MPKNKPHFSLTSWTSGFSTIIIVLNRISVIKALEESKSSLYPTNSSIEITSISKIYVTLASFCIVSTTNDRQEGNEGTSDLPSSHFARTTWLSLLLWRKLLIFNPLMSYKRYKCFNFNENLMFHVLNGIYC